MLRHRTLLPLVMWVATTGCITGFRHPLGPVGQGYIDERLLGAWTCVSTTDQGPGELTFLKFDGSQYYMHMADRQSEPQDLRAVATRLEEASFVSLRVIGPKANDEWTVLQYTISDAGQLTLKYVDPQAFEDIIDEPQAIRDRLVTRLEDPEVLADLLRCTRRDATRTNAGP